MERIEKFEVEIKDLMKAKKEIFLEAKGEGLDVKIFLMNSLAAQAVSKRT